MKKIILSAAIGSILFASESHAVTFNVSLDQVTNQAGSLVPASTLAMLVVDTNGSGFSSIAPGSSLVANTYLTTGDDFIIARNDFASGGDIGAGQFSFVFGIGTADIPNNSNLALFWFPTLTTSSTSIGAGVEYGFYTSSNSTQFGSNSAWNTGANSAAVYTLNAFTANNTGTFGTDPEPGGLSQSALQATLTTVPEPSTYALLALGGLALFFIARRRKAEQA